MLWLAVFYFSSISIFLSRYANWSVIPFFFVEIFLMFYLYGRTKNKYFKLALILAHALQSIQLISIYYTGLYAQELMFTNYDEAQSVGFDNIALAGCFLILNLLLGRALSKKGQHLFGSKSVVLASFAGYVLLFLNTPVYSFGVTLESVYMSHHKKLEVTQKAVDFFYKEKVSSGVINPASLSCPGCNVVVIFTEGFSARTISQKLTPVIFDLQKKSVSIKHYFNHTAATFRGLRGQLLSGYQYRGGLSAVKHDGLGEIGKDKLNHYLDARAIALPEILAHNGYVTTFITPESQGSNLNAMLSSLGFSKVLGYESYKQAQNTALLDRETYDFIWRRLNATSPDGKAVFIGAYTLGTHIGLDSDENRFGDGKNKYLNTIHNMDASFGEFMNKLEHSKFKNNTLLIFTSDHAAYPSPGFNKTFNSDNKYFVDEVPFIIWRGGLSVGEIDVHGMNSLSLAPTLLNLLSIKNESNFFAGCSIFDSDCNNELGYVSALGDEYFSTRNSKVIKYVFDSKTKEKTSISESVFEKIQMDYAITTNE